MTTPYVDPQSVHNPTPGASPPASWGDTVRDGLEFLVRLPGCIVHRSTAFEIADDTLTAIEFNAADIRDTDGYHSTVTNTTRMTVPAGLGGLYEVGANVTFNDGLGNRVLRLRKNGSSVFGSVQAVVGTGEFVGQTVCVPVVLNAGDYVEVVVYQDSGAALNVSSSPEPLAWMRLVALS
jgi:hypothetical protein